MYLPSDAYCVAFGVRSFDSHAPRDCCFHARYDIALIGGGWPATYSAGRLDAAPPPAARPTARIRTRPFEKLRESPVRPTGIMLSIALVSVALAGCALRDTRDDYAYSAASEGLWGDTP